MAWGSIDNCGMLVKGCSNNPALRAYGGQFLRCAFVKFATQIFFTKSQHKNCAELGVNGQK